MTWPPVRSHAHVNSENLEENEGVLRDILTGPLLLEKQRLDFGVGDACQPSVLPYLGD